jgi:hypothetical protein
LTQNQWDRRWRSVTIIKVKFKVKHNLIHVLQILIVVVVVKIKGDMFKILLLTAADDKQSNMADFTHYVEREMKLLKQKG